jgi:aspartokinase
MMIGGLVENHHLVMYHIDFLDDKPGAAGKILKILAENKIKFQLITESGTTTGAAVMTICVDMTLAEKIDKLFTDITQLKSHLKIKKVDDVSIIGIYSPHFREKPVLAAKFCKILGEAEINILSISSSISSISSVIASDHLEKAKAAVLNEFELP